MTQSYSTVNVPLSIRQAQNKRGLELSQRRAEKKGVSFKKAVALFGIQVELNGGWKDATSEANLLVSSTQAVRSDRARDLEAAAIVVARNNPDRKVRIIKSGADRAVLRYRYSSKTNTLGTYK